MREFQDCECYRLISTFARPAAETHFLSGMGWKYLGTITFVFGDATAISCKKDRSASSAGS
jgi:hypothetical protein